MWSGPRNISTALLRAWGNRADCCVSDEPLYSPFLEATGLDHPVRQEILRHHERDYDRVVQWLTGPIPQGRAIWYQKHMAQHLLPQHSREWLGDLDHAFLIRDPRAMIASYHKIIPNPQPLDLGLPQQVEIFERVRDANGAPPPVIDAADVLQDPPGLLAALCQHLGVAFDENMLSWPDGPRDSDGVWGPHWYASVYQTTGFQPWQPHEVHLSAELEDVARRCKPAYDFLHAQRLR